MLCVTGSEDIPGNLAVWEPPAAPKERGSYDWIPGPRTGNLSLLNLMIILIAPRAFSQPWPTAVSRVTSNTKKKPFHNWQFLLSECQEPPGERAV